MTSNPKPRNQLFYLEKTLPTRDTVITARVNGLELVNIKLLVDKPDLEVDGIGGRQIDLDLIYIEPEEETLHLDALELGDGAVADSSRYGLVVVDEVVELDGAGLGEVDDEAAVVGEGEVGDGIG